MPLAPHQQAGVSCGDRVQVMVSIVTNVALLIQISKCLVRRDLKVVLFIQFAIKRVKSRYLSLGNSLGLEMSGRLQYVGYYFPATSGVPLPNLGML